MTINDAKSFINNALTKAHFARLYGANATDKAVERYTNLLDAFSARFADAKDGIRFFSSPGRSEICGNHTDHNLGKVVAASIQLDCIGAVTKTNNGVISVHDITYKEDFALDCNNTSPVAGESGSIALVRGMIEGFKKEGFAVGGFNAVFQSDVIAAAGVSSSASFEMMICTILNNLYNEGKIPISTLARIGQFAENHYWQKSSGLLDQMACAAGGMVTLDFANPSCPLVKHIAFDFAKQNYELIIVNTGKGHADLSKEYSAIPNEMKSIAKFFGKDNLISVDEEDVLKNFATLKQTHSHRAILRALHFFEENKRVLKLEKALEQNNFREFLSIIKESGESSWKWLQNTFVAEKPEEQSIALVLAITNLFIEKNCPFTSANPGVCRVHGGGFAGVIMALLPSYLTDEYTHYIEKALGYDPSISKNSPVYRFCIRDEGAIELC